MQAKRLSASKGNTNVNGGTRSIFITGAGSGIGKSSVRLFAQKGYQVFATYRKNEDRQLLEELDNVFPIQMDVTIQADIESAFEIVKRETRETGLYAIINNAGIVYSMPFEYVDFNTARKVMETNVMAPLIVSQTFLPLLKKYNEANTVRSRVVNITSWTAEMTLPLLSVYSASKYSVLGLTESMYYDLGLLGVHAVAASPGTTKTPILDKGADREQMLNGIPAEKRAFYEPFINRYCDAGDGFKNANWVYTPDQIARKLFTIVEIKRPKAIYQMAPDAKLIAHFFKRFIPFSWRAALVKKMFGLRFQ